MRNEDLATGVMWSIWSSLAKPDRFFHFSLWWWKKGSGDLTIEIACDEIDRFCWALIAGDKPKRGANDLCGCVSYGELLQLMQPHKSLAPLFGSSPAINARQNLSISSQANSMVRSPDPFFCHHKEKQKNWSGYTRLHLERKRLAEGHSPLCCNVSPPLVSVLCGNLLWMM